LRESDHTALVIVPERQLSLAIGNRGQNARLAARLTGWRIDIVRPEEQPAPSNESTAAASFEV
jgi:N utilization substance protein A